MIVYSDFIVAFPVFGDTATYPQATVNFWLVQAYGQLNANRFGTALDLAVMLFVAHNIVLSARSAKTASTGGIAGEASGPLASKSVGPVSKGYDAGLATLPGAGEFNDTSYGKRFFRLLRGASAGPVYVPGHHRRAFPFAVPGFPYI